GPVKCNALLAAKRPTAGRGPSALSEKLNPGLLFQFRADEFQPRLAELPEGANHATLPNSAIISDRDQVALHHAAKMLAAIFAVILQIGAWKAHTDSLIVPRDKKADIAQAIVHPRREMGPQLGARKDVVAMFPVGVAYRTMVEINRLAVLKVPWLARGQQ